MRGMPGEYVLKKTIKNLFLGVEGGSEVMKYLILSNKHCPQFRKIIPLKKLYETISNLHFQC